MFGWVTNKLARETRSPLFAETQQACNCDDEMSVARMFWAELHGEVPERNNCVAAMRKS